MELGVLGVLAVALGGMMVLCFQRRTQHADAEDRWCANCGYSARGAKSSRCPECGAYWQLSRQREGRRDTVIVVGYLLLCWFGSWGILHCAEGIGRLLGKEEARVEFSDISGAMRIDYVVVYALTWKYRVLHVGRDPFPYGGDATVSATVSTPTTTRSAKGVMYRAEKQALFGADRSLPLSGLSLAMMLEMDADYTGDERIRRQIDCLAKALQDPATVSTYDVASRGEFTHIRRSPVVSFSRAFAVPLRCLGVALGAALTWTLLRKTGSDGEN